MNKEYYETVDRIKFELEKIRPKLIMDGGNIEFINYKDGILKVRFLGECAHCELSHITLKYAIEKTLIEKIPEIKKSSTGENERCLRRFFYFTYKKKSRQKSTLDDVPEGIRTPDRRLRRPLLYPAELLRHI